jgi:hypothetical protein
VHGVFTILLESVRPASDCRLGVWAEGNSRDEDNRDSGCDRLLKILAHHVIIAKSTQATVDLLLQILGGLGWEK